MKARKVSALRSKRGLRPVVRVAEPPVVGLTPQTTMMTEGADTMKTCILSPPQPVQPQPVCVTRDCCLFVGPDLHADTSAASVASSDSSAMCCLRTNSS